MNNMFHIRYVTIYFNILLKNKFNLTNILILGARNDIFDIKPVEPLLFVSVPPGGDSTRDGRDEIQVGVHAR